MWTSVMITCAQRHEDAHFKGAQVATENLSQDFPRVSQPYLGWFSP